MRIRTEGGPSGPRPGRFERASAAAAIALLLAGGLAGRAGRAEEAPAAAEKAEEKPAEKPITTTTGPIGNLLRKWYAEGTAAGNVGDFYDNRDRGHSGLDLAPYPQLQAISYTEEEKKRRIDLAFQGRVLPHVVFGNSSTSAGVLSGGSNTRQAYCHPATLALLYAQYTHTSLYIYPEHQDHDPGHNGSPGHGDLFPTNTPYLITSQGSSGSDRSFMRAMPYVLAAFRPEVKRRLVETGLLVPTIQMILRRTGKQLKGPDDYLTGRAHPSVFEGGWVDDLRMVEMAHEIPADAIPPMVQVRVVEEDEPVAGRDFFDPRGGERLADTPAVLARIFRGRNRVRRIVVSAEASYDLNQRPLEFHWVVLRGDAAQIQIKKTNEAGSVAEVLVPFHERGPVAKGSEIESNRVDIGVFVHNGAYYSAPGFITFLCLDDEARTYGDDGRVLEIGYGLGETEVSVAKWADLLDLCRPEAGSLGARLLKAPFKGSQIAALARAGEEFRTAQAAAEAAQKTEKEAQSARRAAADAVKAAERARDEAKAAQEKAPGDEPQSVLDKAESALGEAKRALGKAEAEAKTARQAADAAKRAAADVLSKKRDDLRGTVRDLVERAIAGVAADPGFYLAHRREIAEALAAGGDDRKAAFEKARRRLIAWGLLRDAPGDAFELAPVRKGASGDASALTRYEKALLDQFNGQVLGALVYPGLVNLSYKRNYVDPRLATPKTWRDVYRYAPNGECLGWTRYDGENQTEFDPWGLAVVEKDALGRCVKARSVRYEQEPPKGRFGLSANPLKTVLEDRVTEYEYADENDWRGRLKAPAPVSGGN